jgi:hypothetical protein
MSTQGDSTRPRRYEVRLIAPDGSVRTFRVTTYLGELKAVYLASSSLRSVFSRTAYHIEVVDLGEADGIERGDLIDRMEW